MRVFLLSHGLFSLLCYNAASNTEHRIIQRIGRTDQVGHIHTAELHGITILR
jgi:hypothetical protein